ncbi:hypothetical protein AQJ43_09460 [Streptomyces avermitilis]|uniref:Uncharacterized protein n=1 Tax=Streptomyces avermitilis TaxID=33903 RepID=A0A4D4N2V0_STRAX|nr:MULTISPECIES: hypothetical protein [Streptomyces]KUN55159.1 hypothetical protein AQJ43_09460 [Streptomyces avermitilis]MYS97048.1 hypothetical protein [Streptomyces sp. SID5469]OOV26733.1 hypothetical protein SM007_23135 [Streptomyces avermitilis]BBJ49077.1 hypothetical protein SAVMC3_17060 [Streptomyces avermitilis]GDY61120.1 hypothetical protein SAV14893_005130 [Streptomyces avermitilis]
MTSDHDLLWRRCAHLGRVLLPVVDEEAWRQARLLVHQEAWRQARRHEHLEAWGINIVEGERLIELFAALAAHAVTVDISASAAEIDVLPPSVVADAATGKRDLELLAGLPDTFADGRDELAVKVFRLYTYRGGQYSRRLFQLSTELRRALIVLRGTRNARILAFAGSASLLDTPAPVEHQRPHAAHHLRTAPVLIRRGVKSGQDYGTCPRATTRKASLRRRCL